METKHKVAIIVAIIGVIGGSGFALSFDFSSTETNIGGDTFIEGIGKDIALDWGRGRTLTANPWSRLLLHNGLEDLALGCPYLFIRARGCRPADASGRLSTRRIAARGGRRSGGATNPAGVERRAS